MDIESIAKVCYEVNKAFCESIGDFSQPSWDKASEWQKESVINGVTFHLENPNSKPSDSHNNWMKKKLENGWKFGEVRNPETKEHPCIVPYDELPLNQKSKDYLFIAVVRSMISLNC